MKASGFYHWDLLNEVGNHVVDHMVKVNDQRPSKEWGFVGWYRHLTAQDITKGTNGQTIYTAPVDPI